LLNSQFLNFSDAAGRLKNVFLDRTGSLKIGDFGMAVPEGTEEDGMEGDDTYMVGECGGVSE
jgi:hypothetical protein